MSPIAVKLENLKKTFKGTLIFENVTLELHEGRIYGFLGYNGSGKSVLFKIICGFLRPDEGNVEVFGKKIGKDIDFPESTGVIIETPGFLEDYSAYRNLKFLASIRNDIHTEQIHKVLETVGLDSASKQPVKKFSLGMRQRLAIAQAIMEKPKLLILDEPFNGLDKQGVERMRNLLLDMKRSGTTMLLTSHMSEDIELLCDHRFEFNNKMLEPVSS
ncbi:ABC transporter ATP-binding protein [Paenibacillus sp. SYP-B4298]|uniref:ABC transporter ATP-binding protein n=1 Tax=Paenibacillus sp. SYP-B4298 TaxID=2996034 RepID=UPI0022DD88E5|nr:ATP-binding cassette domain-containing protein [Paenibacillus sp. SYP-B4298]